MLGVLEKFFNVYYQYKECFIVGTILICIVLILGKISLKKITENHLGKKVLFSFMQAITIVCLGQILAFLGLVPVIDYEHFNVCLFTFFAGIIIGFGIIQMIIYKQVRAMIIQMCDYGVYVTYFQLFLLTVTQHIEICEFVAGFVSIITFKLLSYVLDLECKKEREEEREKEALKNAISSDKPNPDLYFTRKQQLDKFIKVLEEQKSEPYAVMINAEWGNGKSSFVLGLEKKLENDSFIWINAGSEKSVTDIMSEISGKVLEILKEKNVFIEKESWIEKYFFAFTELMLNTKIGFFAQFNSIINKKKMMEEKEYLNDVLSQMQGTIYLIIDDLDRCGNEYQIKMFKVLRESTNLINCKTIFLVDKNQFLGKEQENSCIEKDISYIEKYISYELDLCDVGFDEIVNYTFDAIIAQDFISSLNSSVIEDNRYAKNLIIDFPNKIVQKIEEEIDKEGNKEETKDENERERRKNKIEWLKKKIICIRNNISNPRKVKNYLKGIKRNIENISLQIASYNEDYGEVGWLEAIIEVQFVHNFLPDVYDKIKMSDGIYESGSENISDVIDIIFESNTLLFSYHSKKEAIINNIIYRLDVIDFEQLLEDEYKFIKELHENPEIKNINKYAGYARSIDDLRKILQLAKKGGFKSQSQQQEFLEIMFKKLSEQSSPIKSDNIEFLSYSRDLIAYAEKCDLTERQRNICIYSGDKIVRRTLVDNFQIFSNILAIFFRMTDVTEKRQDKIIVEFNEFFRFLKVVDKRITDDLTDEVEQFEFIKRYFQNLKQQLLDIKYKSIGIDFEKEYEVIERIFAVCEYWMHVEENLDEKKTENKNLMNKFFDYEHVYSFKNNVFENVSNLEEALLVLKHFYVSNESNYKSEYSLILLRVMYNSLLIYEKNKKWFASREKEIGILFFELKDLVCNYSIGIKEYDKNILSMIKTYAFKFDLYCKEESNNKSEEEKSGEVLEIAEKDNLYSNEEVGTE